jgi:hypothetical protein
MSTDLVQIGRIFDDDESTVAGTAFGSCDVMPAHLPRQRDRRHVLGDLLQALTRSLDRRLDVSLMRGAFEATLRRALPLRAVHLRDGGSRWTNHADAASAPESVALEVPGGNPDMPGVLEATFDPGCCLGDWDFQLLGHAAHIGALVLEIERSRVQLARAGVVAMNRLRPDGSVPLVGSTPVMQELRSTIERVAATDFTVLLEGESDPQQKAKLLVFP